MIQHRLVKLWDLGVESGRITPEELVDMTSTAIARRFGLARKGAVAPGKDADLVVFDPSTPFEFSTRTSHMNVDYDLFEGERSTGSVRHTFCRGEMVYDRGEILTQPGHGRFVPRSLRATAPWPCGRRPRARDLRELAAPDRRTRRCPARLLDRRLVARARLPALAPGRAPARAAGRRRGEPLGGPPR